MFKKRLAYFTLAVFGALFFAAVAMAAATQGGGSATLESPTPGVSSFGELLEKIAGVAGSIVGAVSILMFVIAGILFMTSAGSPERIQSAKSALMYAVLGAIIALAAKGIAGTLTSLSGM